jgi:RNA polymerase sigma-70 factor, ECF subfamily
MGADETPPLGREHERAASELLQHHLTMLRGYLRHLLGSAHDADDVAQDVCLTVLRDPAVLLRGADPGAYLRGIARHLASRHRRRMRRPAMLEEMVEMAWEEHAEALDAQKERRALAGCLARLTARARQLLAWRYERGLNAGQIAAELSTSSEAVRMALMRARQALARCLSERLDSAAPTGQGVDA